MRCLTLSKFFIAALTLPLAANLSLAQTAPVGSNCSLVFQACPGRFDQTTLQVPKDILWLDPVFPSCKEKIEVQTQGPGSPPSIVFIIDNSGSMSKDGKDSDEVNDPNEARFKVVESLIDTLRAVTPSAEIGLVIFTRRLAFDHRDNAFFKTAFPGDTSQHDSYVPLTALNHVFPNGVSGADTLKDLLKFSGEGNLIYHTTRPGSRANADYGPLSTRDGTDISLGFEAAKVAMAEARAPRSNQYFVFLSDGSPSNLDNGRESLKDAFVQGENTPTTFTVFFKQTDKPADVPTAPANIVKMTENIKKNGFSTSNPQSNVWAINLPGSQLLSLLQANVLPTLLTTTKPSQTQSVALVAGGLSYGEASRTANQFAFSKRIPLLPDQTELALTYTFRYVDSGVTKTQSMPYSVKIQRIDAAVLSDSLGKSCRESAALALYRDGQVLNRVTADDERLEARLTLPAGERCDSCFLQLQPSHSDDREALLWASAAGFPSVTFSRSVAAVPLRGNGKLEHLPTDSLILFYQNPENPLDQARRSYAYVDVSTRLQLTFPNAISRLNSQTGVLPGPADDKHWTVLDSSGRLQVTTENPHCCLHQNALITTEDSLRHVGIRIEASRGFAVDIQVFTHVGTFVNKLSLAVSQDEFAHLDKGAAPGSRQLLIRWNNRAESGRLVGTGVYILRTKVTLLPIPGVAETLLVHAEYRRVGVIRGE